MAQAAIPGGYFVRVNARLCELTGYGREELAHMTFADITHPEDRQQHEAAVHTLLAGQEPQYTQEIRYLHRNGGIRRVRENGTVIRDIQGQPVRTMAIIQELPEPEPEALTSSQPILDAALAASPYAFTVLRALRDQHGQIRDFVWEFVNPAATRILRVPSEDLIGKRLLEVLPGNRDELFPAYCRVVETGMPYESEVRYQADNIDGWFRNLTVRLGDRIAVYFHDITARKQVELALMEADRNKDEFLAMLGHELKNPLSAIHSARVMLQRQDISPARRAWGNRVMDRQHQQLGRLIDDLLDVARITQGKIVLKSTRLELGQVVRHAIDAIMPLIEDARHRLSVSMDAQPLWVDGDATRLEQVVVNLLTNAARYTPNGGQIWVSLKGEDGQAVLRVRDTGIGISAPMLPRIFDRFIQADRPLERAAGGLGLGLSLVRMLVELHSGTVSAASRGQGHGSEFTVRLPAAGAGIAATRGNLAAVTGEQPRRILVVDDNPDGAYALSLVLELAGYETELAYNGTAALSVAHSYLPEVILLDISLPDMDGYQVARALRDMEELEDALIVAVSGYGRPEDIRRAVDAGCDEHQLKPVDHYQLLELIGRYARQREHGHRRTRRAS